jgi:hypothetical protein
LNFTSADLYFHTTEHSYIIPYKASGLLRKFKQETKGKLQVSGHISYLKGMNLLLENKLNKLTKTTDT